MAVNKGEIGIYGVLVNDTPEAILAHAIQILDENEGKNQEDINKELRASAGDNNTIIEEVRQELNTHASNKENPHSVTKQQVGLGNVDNTSDIDKPISTATQTALDEITSSLGDLEHKIGKPNGIASLNEEGIVPSSQLPSYVDDVIEVDSFDMLPEIGEAGKIYVVKDTNLTYRWSGTIYVEISKSLALGETSSTAYAGDKGKDTTDKVAKIRNTQLSHIKDVGTFTVSADKVSMNYECYEGDQYGDTGTTHTADIPAVTETAAGVMTAADKAKLENINNALKWTILD